MRKEGEEIRCRDEWQGIPAEGDDGDKREIEGKLTCSCLSFRVLHSCSGCGIFRVQDLGGGGGGEGLRC